ncbi:MAG: hypothetical protein AYK19_02395 [Theionarchaea archaeon DG-70-1]|nr:MAG: hypothetical protein AYK19_02395 [Theionarchaea archaeon DG-70-1]
MIAKIRGKIMNPRIGAVLTAALLSTALVGAVQEVPPTDFFIDPETGESAAVIVVGKEAAAMDVVSATLLATAINAARHTGDITFTTTYRTVHLNIDPFTNALDPLHIGFPTVDVPDPRLYWEWEHNPTLTTYPLSLWYFDDPNGFWGSNDGHFQPWETHEEIQIRFDAYTNNTSAACVTCVYGGDIDVYKLGSLSWYETPGLTYRADNIFAPPMVLVEPEYEQPTEFPLFSVDLGPYLVLFVPEPWMVAHDRLPQFTLFDTTYTVVDAGPVLDINFTTNEKGSLHGTPYIITGAPHFEAPVYLYKDKPVQFSDYTVEVKEVDVDHNKALLDIYIYGELLESFWMVMEMGDFVIPPTMEKEKKRGFSPDAHEEDFPFSDYDTCDDLNNNGIPDPGEITNIIAYDYNKDGIPDYHKWVVSHVEKDIWADYTWWYYTDDDFGHWLLFNATDFVIEGVKLFIGAHGTIGIEVKVYWLENKKWWYNKLCGDPWVEKPQNHQTFIDVCESGWDEVNGPSYVYQPPGTGLWPPSGLNSWTIMRTSMFIGNGFLDTNDGHIGYEYNSLALSGVIFPDQYDLDKDAGVTNDCRTSDWSVTAECTNMYDIEDPGVWHGPGMPLVELNVYLCDKMCAPDQPDQPWVIPGLYPKDRPYFTVEVTDAFLSCGDVDGITYDTILGAADSVTLVDEVDLVMLDTEFDFAAWTSACDYNLVLVGGPVANSIVEQLVAEGVSTVNWAISLGQWEYLNAPYTTYDILIIAGSDRDATRAAVVALINELY